MTSHASCPFANFIMTTFYVIKDNLGSLDPDSTAVPSNVECDISQVVSSNDGDGKKRNCNLVCIISYDLN